MAEPIMVYSSLMRMQIDRLNSIAQNSSNVNSTGYLQELNQIDQQHFVALLQGNASTKQPTFHHSTKLGSIKVTGKGTDLALGSEHWFVLSLGSQTFVTRNGNFLIGDGGELKLGNYSVVGETGPVRGVTKDFVVGGDATIFMENVPVDKLKIVKMDAQAKLRSVGEGVYIAEGPQFEEGHPQVLQGALNNSNVDIQADMTRMIEITRQIESIQRAMSAYNDLLDTGINQLGK